MPKKQVSMKDFGTEQAERIGIYRSIHFGIRRPSKPRHIPDFREACVLVDPAEQGRGLGRRLNGSHTAMSNGLIQKLSTFGLMDTYRVRYENGKEVQALILNAHGLELFFKGKVDTTTAPSATSSRVYAAILETIRRNQVLSNGIDLKQRNSTVDVDEVEFATDAKSIGVYVNGAGFMATAYDSHGVRITDVFIQNFEPGDREWKWKVTQDQNEYPIKPDDLEPALRLAQLLNVREDKLFLDDKLAGDMWNSETFDYAGRVCLSPHLTKPQPSVSRRGFPSR